MQREGTCIRVVFVCFGVLAAIDIIMLFFSVGYREILGKPHGALENIWRFLLDGLLMILYRFLSAQLGKAEAWSRFLVWHGVLGGLLGVVLCIPFGGFFLAPFTPVSLLYLGAMLWTPMGFSGSLTVAITFVMFNIYLIWVGVRSGKKESAIA